MPEAGAVVVADGDVPAPPSEASAEGPTIAAATASPVTAPTIGALHLLTENDMCSSDLDRAAPIAARFGEHPRRR
jgi:hypothetical protein